MKSKFTKILLLFIFLTGIPEVNYSQSHKDIEKERELFKNNKVKSRISLNQDEIIEYDSEGRINTLTTINDDNKVQWKYYYDKLGKLIKKVNLNQHTSTIYKYDSKENIIEERNQEEYTIYKYDDNNNIIESIINYEDEEGGIITVNYKYEQDLIVEKKSSCDMGFEYIESFTYDSNGNLISKTLSEQHCDMNDLVLIESTSYDYYENGLLSKIITTQYFPNAPISSSNYEINYTYEFY